MRQFICAAAASLSWATPFHAQGLTAEEAFVDANILAVFYHEFGHAVIDLMQVPIFGQEEDAADVMSVMMINWLFEEDTAQSLAYDSAFGYINDPDGAFDVPYWDVHGPDEQRYFNHVCLFYGANPDEREDLAEDLGLPDERAESCPDEYDQAAASWGMILDEMSANPDGAAMVFQAGTGKNAEVINRVLSAEIEALNDDIRLPHSVAVVVEDCDEANAFYDPEAVSITVCTEFVPHLVALFEQL